MSKKRLRIIKVIIILLILLFFSLNISFLKNPVVIAQMQSSMMSGGCSSEDLNEMVNDMFDLMNEDLDLMGESVLTIKGYEEAGYTIYTLHHLDQGSMLDNF